MEHISWEVLQTQLNEHAAVDRDLFFYEVSVSSQ